MSAKSAARVSYESRVDQDEKLTGKHIKTLFHLQELHVENEQLRARVAQLEVYQARVERCDILERELNHLRTKLSKCDELHTVAKESREKLQQMQRDCLARIDECNTTLTEKHKQEMMRLVSDKLEAENAWVLEKQQFEQKIQELEKENALMKNANTALQDTAGATQKLRAEIDEMNIANESLKRSNDQLHTQNRQHMDEILQLKQAKESLKAEIECLNTKMAALEIQRSEAQAEATQYRDLPSEVLRLKQTLHETETEKDEIAEKNEKLDQELRKLRFSLEDATQSLKHMYKERDLLKNSITGLINEIQALKSQVPEQHTFVDFVQLKREYNTLRDEHQKLLKRKTSKPNVLPTLKPEPLTSAGAARVSSGDSIRTRASFNS